MGYKIGLTEVAQADLGAVVRFLAAKSPEAAERIAEPMRSRRVVLCFRSSQRSQ
ncbi:MAG: hypothetical protein WC661_09755 [Opitutaceae bacterium]|jgi:hypothetical protein